MKDDGFTLLEMLVALAILAAGAAAGIQVYARAVDVFFGADGLRVAASNLESILARVGTEVAVQPGVMSGRLADGSNWEMTLLPRPRHESERPEDRPVVRPYEVRATIYYHVGGMARSYSVSTVRLGAWAP